MARRWMGWLLVAAAVGALAVVRLADTKERRGRTSPPVNPTLLRGRAGTALPDSTPPPGGAESETAGS